MHSRIVTLIGGTGFVGTAVTRQLLAEGYTVRVITRSPEQGAHLKPMAQQGRLQLISGDLNDIESIRPYLADSSAIINLVGILYEKGRAYFHLVHHQNAAALAEAIAQCEAKHGAKNFIHVSALGIEQSRHRADYAKSKYDGEIAIRNAFPSAIILRPSVIFGSGDNFTNQFADMVRALPIMPLIGRGQTLFQPIHVEDVSHAITQLLAKNTEETAGQTYELGGPDIFSLRDITEMLCRVTGKSPLLLPLPFWVSSILGFALGLMPTPPLTCDQVQMLKSDSIVSPDALTLAHLGIKPARLHHILPRYLTR